MSKLTVVSRLNCLMCYNTILERTYNYRSLDLSGRSVKCVSRLISEGGGESHYANKYELLLVAHRRADSGGLLEVAHG